MHDGFGEFADSIQGATLTYLKSARSTTRWHVHQLGLRHSVLQLGVDGGAGITHGVIDPGVTALVMQLTDYDDRAFLDGVPCPSTALISLQPGTPFTFLHRSSLTWFSWTISKDVPLAQRLALLTAPPSQLHGKRITLLQPQAAMKLQHGVISAFEANPTSPSLMAQLENSLFAALEVALEGPAAVVDLPSAQTRAAERTVFNALRYAQSRPDQTIEISDLADAANVNYRTLLRAFQRFLRMSPKRYLKMRQINNVYHAIRNADRTAGLADILDSYAVSQFGRFAGEYRHIFGELPSDTMQRSRARQSDALAGQYRRPSEGVMSAMLLAPTDESKWTRK